MKIVVTGDWTHSDFVDVVNELSPQAQFGDFDALQQFVSAPDLLVLAQARRHQFSPLSVEKLIMRWPTTPAVHLLSSWCEGELRSGKPLPGWTRVYWHRWAVEFSRFVAAHQANRTSAWDRAIDPQCKSAFDTGRLPGGQCFEIGILARWNSEALMIEQMLQPLGHAIGRHDVDLPGDRSPKSVDAWLIIGDSCDSWLERCITHAKQAGRRALKIIVMGFPRRQEVDRLQKLGGRPIRVLAKPFEVQQVQQLLQSFAANRLSVPGGNR